MEPLTYKVMRKFEQAAQRHHRLEAIRAESKKAWQEPNLDTIIVVVRKIPDNVFHEAPILLVWNENALIKMGGMYL